MKLINAGFGAIDFQQYQYNCTRNKSCQPEYFIPIKQLSDLTFFLDLPGKPDDLGLVFKAVDKCCSEVVGGDFNDDFSDDFLIGGEVPCEYDVVFNDYVVGQKPNGSWYAVFGNPTIALPEGVSLKCFFIKIIVTVGGGDYYYYSQQMCFDPCDDLTLLQACYPNVTSGDAEDCNGIYYGFHQGPDDPIGNSNYRYFHKTYVRKGSIISSKVSFSLNLFNSRKTYKSTINKEQVLEFELVPDFYKEMLIGVLGRGNILINGVEYVLATTQEFSVIDYDSKLWKMDINLAEECKRTFGCGVSDCSLPEEEAEPCGVGECNDISIEEVEGQYQVSFPEGCTLNEDELIEWEVRDQDNEIVDSGSITDPEDGFIIDGITPAENCYLVRWRKKCADGSFTSWYSEQYGNCEGEGGGFETCSADLMSYSGSVTVTKTSFGIIGLTGTILCPFVCPCNLTTGTILTRITPSSPCLPACNLVDSSGEWLLGVSGYITYIGPDIVIPCEGLELNQSFNEEDCGI